MTPEFAAVPLVSRDNDMFPVTRSCLVLGAALRLTNQLWFRSKGNEHTRHSNPGDRPQSPGRRANGSPVGHLCGQFQQRELSILRHPIQCAPQRLLATAAGSAGPGHTGHDPATGCASSVPQWRLSAANLWRARIRGRRAEAQENMPRAGSRSSARAHRGRKAG